MGDARLLLLRCAFQSANDERTVRVPIVQTAAFFTFFVCAEIAAPGQVHVDFRRRARVRVACLG